MEATDRTLLVAGLLALVAIVSGSPIPAAAAAAILAVTAILEITPVVGTRDATRTLESARVVEGGVVEGEATVQATARAPALVTLHDREPAIGDPKRPSRTTRTTFGKIDLAARHEVELPVRGLARFGPLDLTYVDPLGFTRRHQRLLDPEIVRVWPRGEELKEHPLTARYERMLSGNHPVRNKGNSQNFYGIREYLPTDPMRAVNWKATAAKDEMMVNEYTQETYGEVTLFLDTRRVTGVGTLRENPLHEVARTATTLAAAVREQGDLLRAYAHGPTEPKRFKAEPGRPWTDQLADWLSELEPEGDQDVKMVFEDTLPHLTPKSIIVFITPLVGENPLADAPARALALENTVVVMAPPLPEALPDDVRERLQAQREERFEEVRDMGIEVLDLARRPSVDTAFQEREVAR